jgi:hypothetical protein
VRFAITTSANVALVDRVVLDASNLVGETLSVKFNRCRAALLHSNPANRLGKPLLAQFIDQVDALPAVCVASTR